MDIKVELGEWIYNAGLVGFCNIVGKDFSEAKNIEELIFTEIDLENFEEKYFKYLIETYEPVLSYSKLLSIEDFLLKHKNEKFENFTEKSLEYFNDYITKVAKYYLKSNSYKAAYELIESEIDILELEKTLTKVNQKKSETIDDIKEELLKTIEKIETMLDYLKLEQSKKYLAGKNVIYNIIRNGWDGISFLNRVPNEKDFYIDYKNYFIEPAIEYLEEEKEKYKYNCFTCNGKMKNLNNDLSFINNMGFDVARKSSHVWNFDNDIAICPTCKLILSCIPAGFTYIYDKGIFINDNSSLFRILKTNQNIKSILNDKLDNNNYATNKALIKTLFASDIKGAKKELQDIQVIRLLDGKYYFNILSRNTLNIIIDSEEDLEKLESTGFKEINTYFSIYNIVVDNILNNRNMYLLIEKLLHYKISKLGSLYYNGSHIIRTIKINTRYLKEVGALEINKKDFIKDANRQGYFLREAYRAKGSVDKLNGISYRLLNSLKINDMDMFMDTVLNSYLYTKKAVPQIIVDSQNDIDIFKTMGYSFIAGLIEGQVENVEKKEEENEK